MVFFKNPIFDPIVTFGQNDSQMPLVPSAYTSTSIFRSAHFSTIFSAKIRRVYGVEQHRERVDLSDGDFLDIDWTYARGEYKSSKLCILIHGLEGNAQRPYMLGQIKLLALKGYDCAAINLRGCSGEINRAYNSYNSGSTQDLHEVIGFMEAQKGYQEYYLCGFSLGGNQILKYLGEGRSLTRKIKAAAAISTPVHLHGSLLSLSRKQNWIYRWSFMKDLKKKYRDKIHQYPDKMNHHELDKIRSLLLFDELYTAPAHGFENALDYYTRSSSLAFLKNIDIPTYLLNAKNDSFLDAQCYPTKIAQENMNLYLETPEKGGHVAFFLKGKFYYNELRTAEFFKRKNL